MKELKYLNKYFTKYKYHFLLGIVATIIAQIFSLYTPKLIGDSINALTNKNLDSESIKNLLLENIIWVLITTVIAGILTFVMRQTLIVMSRYVEFDLKNEVFRQYENLSQNFYKRYRTGSLMNRISEDVGRVRMYVGPAVMYSLNTFIRFAVVIVQMSIISPELTLYTVLPLPILSYLIFKLSTEINVRSGIFQANLSQLSSYTQEVFFVI